MEVKQTQPAQILPEMGKQESSKSSEPSLTAIPKWIVAFQSIQGVKPLCLEVGTAVLPKIYIAKLYPTSSPKKTEAIYQYDFCTGEREITRFSGVY